MYIQTNSTRKAIKEILFTSEENSKSGNIFLILFCTVFFLTTSMLRSLQYSCLKIPWIEEPGRLQSMGVAESRTRLSDFTFMHWRRKWQPTPVFLPGEFQGPWWAAVYGVAQSDTTEVT